MVPSGQLCKNHWQPLMLKTSTASTTAAVPEREAGLLPEGAAVLPTGSLGKPHCHTCLQLQSFRGLRATHQTQAPSRPHVSTSGTPGHHHSVLAVPDPRGCSGLENVCAAEAGTMASSLGNQHGLPQSTCKLNLAQRGLVCPGRKRGEERSLRGTHHWTHQRTHWYHKYLQTWPMKTTSTVFPNAYPQLTELQTTAPLGFPRVRTLTSSASAQTYSHMWKHFPTKPIHKIGRGKFNIKCTTSTTHFACFKHKTHIHTKLNQGNNYQMNTIISQ